MDHFELIVLGLLVAVAALTALARVIDVPYPILLVVGGSALGFVPGLPHVALDPDVVLLIFLPPLLFNAAYFTSLAEMRRDARTITLTAVGLVLVTAAAVAVVAHAAIDDLSWAAAFTLGAIVSPTDPLAAASIMHRLGVPARLVAVVEGESLVNDGSALVIYRTAVAAAIGGTFDLLDASWDFVLNVAGGIAIGLAVGRLLVPILRAARVDPLLLVTLSLLAGYVAYIPAEEAGVSGVLAAVSTGLLLGRRSEEITTPTARLNGYGFWEILVFLLNAVLFILTGFQFAQILDEQDRSAATLLWLGAAISATVIGVRLLWLNTTPYIVRALDRRPSQVARRIGWRQRLVAGWSGMRGAVSLAAALALPADFPERDLVIFLSLTVIFATLVVQGLTLPLLIRALGIHDDGAREREEIAARRAAAERAITRLRDLRDADWTRTDSVDVRIGFYEFRLRRLAQRAGELEAGDGRVGDLEADAEARSVAYQRMLRAGLDAEREALLTLRAEGTISDAVLHRLERELDLEDQRLDIGADDGDDDGAHRGRHR